MTLPTQCPATLQVGDRQIPCARVQGAALDSVGQGVKLGNLWGAKGRGADPLVQEPLHQIPLYWPEICKTLFLRGKGIKSKMRPLTLPFK